MYVNLRLPQIDEKMRKDYFNYKLRIKHFILIERGRKSSVLSLTLQRYVYPEIIWTFYIIVPLKICNKEEPTELLYEVKYYSQSFVTNWRQEIEQKENSQSYFDQFFLNTSMVNEYFCIGWWVSMMYSNYFLQCMLSSARTIFHVLVVGINGKFPSGVRPLKNIISVVFLL